MFLLDKGPDTTFLSGGLDFPINDNTGLINHKMSGEIEVDR